MVDALDRPIRDTSCSRETAHNVNSKPAHQSSATYPSCAPTRSDCAHCGAASDVWAPHDKQQESRTTAGEEALFSKEYVRSDLHFGGDVRKKRVRQRLIDLANLEMDPGTSWVGCKRRSKKIGRDMTYFRSSQAYA